MHCRRRRLLRLWRGQRAGAEASHGQPLAAPRLCTHVSPSDLLLLGVPACVDSHRLYTYLLLTALSFSTVQALVAEAEERSAGSMDTFYEVTVASSDMPKLLCRLSECLVSALARACPKAPRHREQPLAHLQGAILVSKLWWENLWSTLATTASISC